MNLVSMLKKAVLKIAAAVPRKAAPSSALSRKTPSPLSDRLLSDALRLAELPSPSEKEEARTAFLLERLEAIGCAPTVDEFGNVTALVAKEDRRAGDESEEGPLLLFADVGTSRWHPLGCFARVDARSAKGSGIADSLGAAALLSVAECVLSKSLKPARDLLLLFAARSLDDPRCEVFRELADAPHLRPAFAFGLRGVGLGALSSRQLGTYRIGISAKTGGGEETRDAVSVVVAVAQKLSGVRWDSDGLTTCRIRRVVAGTGFGCQPTEGVIDVELESPDGGVLELARKAVTATAETVGRESGASLSVSLLGHIPVGDPEVTAELVAVVRKSMKNLKIRTWERPGADPASFLSTLGIPALSIGLSDGAEGLAADELEIQSIDAGRRLLFDLIEKAALK